jgi:four helix bundle protein
MSCQLDVYRVALLLARRVSEVLPRLRRFDRDLACQLRRATTSVPLNIAEGLRRTGRDRGHLLGVALGSAAEVQAVIDVGTAMGILDQGEGGDLEQLVDRVCAMLYRLRGRAA